jgi:hypothetical protein
MKTNHHFSKALGFVFTCLLFFTSPAKADCGGSLQSAYCSDVRITLLYVDANYHAYITINGNISALPCTAGGGLLKLPNDSANFKALYATLLAAHLTTRALNVRLAPIASECTITYVSLP